MFREQYKPDERIVTVFGFGLCQLSFLLHFCWIRRKEKKQVEEEEDGGQNHAGEAVRFLFLARASERARQSVRERASRASHKNGISERAKQWVTKRNEDNNETIEYRRGHRMRRRVKRLDGSSEREFVFLSSLLLCRILHHRFISMHQSVREFSPTREE